MRKNVRFLVVCLVTFIVVSECSECDTKIKYSIKTLNEDYTYKTEHFKTEVISPSEDAFMITLEGKVPKLCKQMLNITKKTHHLYGFEVGLEEIEPGTFENQNLDSQLFLSNNHLTIIRRGTFKNIQITDLDLGYNQIHTIEEGAMENLPKLSNLNLGRNRIKEFHPNSVVQTPKLLFFDMSINKMKHLEDRHFSFMSKERNVGIGVSQNELKQMDPNAFEGIDVFSLNISHNHLSSIPKEIFTENKLHYLGIAHNDLTHLEPEFFEMNTTILRDVQLEGNHFDAETSTKLEPFMEIIEKNRAEDRRYHHDFVE